MKYFFTNIATMVYEVAGLLLFIIGFFGVVGDYIFDQHLAVENNGWILLLLGMVISIGGLLCQCLLYRLYNYMGRCIAN